MLVICHQYQLDVLIAGPGFPVDARSTQASTEFNIFPGQTPQSIADQLRNEIGAVLGEAAQETVDVRIETGEGGELSLVLQSSAGAITTDIDFGVSSKASLALRILIPLRYRTRVSFPGGYA